MTLLYVADQQLARKGIVRLIEPAIGSAVIESNPLDALAQFRRLRPDVTLIDLQLGGMTGVHIIRDMRRVDREARIVALTASDCEEALYFAWEAGVMGFGLKESDGVDLIRVIREAHAGLRSIPPIVEATLRARNLKKILSRREVEVLQQLALGLRNKEISTVLRISEQTVKVHMRAILLKLNARDRTHALSEGLRRGLVRVTP